ncbi:sulfotransferase domain-containing protein [Nitrosopumilus ureiphilus]|uniref:sulfotransferase domain-containing protein n=1 Tax=Nitrosopumilus ureiphilus TaxID=1470067 RepID=UPI002472FE2E|nr:sulfotransferase domain-containing protein [Nitrosopumilus ureiphilus]
MWNPLAAKRISKILPNVKLITLFRNPVDRAYSNYYLGIRAGSENLSFEDAIQVELTSLKNPEIASENNLEKYTNPRSYIAKGFYADQLKIWLKLFQHEQLFITSTEDFESKPQKTLDDIYDFLQIPKNLVINLEKYKVSSYPKMKSETREFLVDFYKIHNAKLFNMIGRKFDWDK